MTRGMVVDTNVLVAANGVGTHADADCQLACVEELRRLASNGIVCIDDQYLILGEYQQRVRMRKGQDGPGTVFFKRVCRTMGDRRRVRITPVTLRDPNDREGRDFVDPGLPPSNLKKDAKFLAVAVKADAGILNATDSDWVEHRALTDRLGVAVRQLCPQHAVRD